MISASGRGAAPRPVRTDTSCAGPPDTIGRVTQPIDDRAAARRFLVIRHLLAPPRSLPAEPASVMAVVERLGSLQFDPLEVAGRNHDLVLLARIAGYRRDWTDACSTRSGASTRPTTRG